VASYKDLVEMTGLSLGTISNVLQGKENVKEKNKEKVYEAMKVLGYRVDYQARSLASNKTNLIGLIVSNIENIAETQILTPMESFAESHNSRIIMATSRNDSGRERKNCESLLSSKVDGLFIFFESLENEAYFRKLAETEEIPIIFLARYLDKCDLPYAAVDNHYAAKCMVEFVRARGHKSITYLDIAEDSMLSPNRERSKGVERECEKNGMGFKKIEYQSLKDDIRVGYLAAENMILNHEMPQLVFPRDDSFAVGFYNACTRYGIRVPEDVSIMGFGNFYSDQITPKKLSTYERNFGKVIQCATEIYLNIQKNKQTGGKNYEIEKKFVRGSIVEGETVLDLN